MEEGGQGEETRREGGREETERATGRKTERQKKARGAAGGGRVKKEGEKERGGRLDLERRGGAEKRKEGEIEGRRGKEERGGKREARTEEQPASC